MISGLRLDSCLRASSLDPSRRAVVEKALRAMKDAIVSFRRFDMGLEGGLTLKAELQLWCSGVA